MNKVAKVSAASGAMKVNIKGFEGFEIFGDALFIKRIDSLVIADTHFGYEGVMAENGVFLPKINYKHIVTELEDAIKKTKAKNLIINGDIKNEFDKVSVEEFTELNDFINFCKQKNVKPILIKGNHDNFVDSLKSLGIEIYKQEFLFDKFLFCHGENMPSEELLNRAEYLITAHEHPAIGLFTELGVKEKLKCFLFGVWKGKKVVVLPSINIFATGDEINTLPKHELLSPILREVDLDAFDVIAEGLYFGKIGQLKKIF